MPIIKADQFAILEAICMNPSRPESSPPWLFESRLHRMRLTIPQLGIINKSVIATLDANAHPRLPPLAFDSKGKFIP